MHPTRKLLVRLLGSVFIFLFFFGTPFVFAFFVKYIVSNANINISLDSLESTTTPLGISIDPAYVSNFDFADTAAKYKISRLHFCGLYDDNGDCIDEVQDLCPYISITPNVSDYTSELSEIGFSQNASDNSLIASGEINGAGDLVDNWDVKIKSPCFDGECPFDYDQNINGKPLPQSLKGKTFNCDLYVESTEPPILVQNIFKNNTAYAATPKNKMTLNVKFTGVYTPPITGASNVLFIPGLEASRLYENKTILGIQIEDQLWEPNTNSDAVSLLMNNDGVSIKSGIYTKDIIEETNTPIPTGFIGENIYKSFSKMMNNLVKDNKIVAWQSYPYDWRKAVQDIVDNGTDIDGSNLKLSQVVDYLASASKTGKVTIVSHSNGGLITKALLKKLVDDKSAGRNNLIDKIDKVILVASPQLGTPSAVPAILHGYDQDINPFYIYSLINTETARELARNMPGAYGLVPSKEYFNHVNTPVISFTKNIFDPYISNDINNFGIDISNYPDQRSFMIGNEGRNNPDTSDTLKPIKTQPSLLTQAEKLHTDIDTLNMPSSVKVIQVAGWGIDTIAGFKYDTSEVCPLPTTPGCIGKYMLDEKPIFTSDGDKTVVSPSALAMDGEKWWLNLFRYNNDKSIVSINNKHSNILEVQPVIDLIYNQINGGSSNSIYLSTTTPVDNTNRLRLSVHSPVTMDSYDSFGNHTGKVCQINSNHCFIEENIPNSSYYEFGEGKYINIPQSNLQKVVLQGTDIGTFTFESEVVYPNGQISTSSFIDIPVTSQTQSEIILNQNNLLQLKLDVDGDGSVDFVVEPSNTFDSIMYLQIMKKTINSLSISREKKEAFNKKIDKIIKLIQSNKSKKTLEIINNFKKELKKSNKHKDEDHHYKKISNNDSQMLLDMLNKLLDNLM